ncbi:hypothetical protein FB451DRAFT_1388849 [Mycena latifolia]|nr:hypothetical protein FB451DRAFT_1388849 [Mycena latifolia]
MHNKPPTSINSQLSSSSPSIFIWETCIMYTLLMARRSTLLVWVSLEAALGTFVWNAYRKP